MGTFTDTPIRVEIRTGSASDQPKIIGVNKTLDALGIRYTQRVLSAHRTPQEMAEAARNLEDDGFWVSIAAAGGSAHLAGMTASETTLPVVALPVMTTQFSGLDSLLSMVQMPPGVPNGTVGPGQAVQAALYAAQIVGMHDEAVRERVARYRNLRFDYSPRKPFVGVVSPAELKSNALPPYGVIMDQLKQFGIGSMGGFASGAVIPNMDKWDAVGAQAMIVVHNTKIAYLPGLLARSTTMPVIAVAAYENNRPIDVITGLFDGFSIDPLLDSERSPVASVGVDRFSNAAIYAAQIIGISNPDVHAAVVAHKKKLHDDVLGIK